MRGIAAGSIVGTPLLYTMEVWWGGMTAPPHHLLLLLAAILLINFLFGFLSGFRQRFSIGEALSESITATAIGILVSIAILWLIGEIHFTAAWSDIWGRVLMETVGVSIGVMFANSQIRHRDRRGESQGQQHGHQHQGNSPKQEQDADWLQFRQDLSDIAATLVGATILSLNIAPTEEVLMIATRLPPWHLLVLMAASLGLCYLILFASGFHKQQPYQQTLFQRPLVETVMAYGLSLMVSLILLCLIGRSEATASFPMAASCVVTLGLPAVIGGAAGRLVV